MTIERKITYTLIVDDAELAAIRRCIGIAVNATNDAPGAFTADSPIWGVMRTIEAFARLGRVDS